MEHYDRPAAYAGSDPGPPLRFGVELFADAEFRVLKLATFLNTPDGKVLAAAVEMLTPPLYRQDVELLIEALKLAGKVQHESLREAVVKGVLVTAGIAVAAALLSNSSR